MTQTASLPHWDMSVVYPGLDSAEFARDFAELLAEIDGAVALFDRAGVDKRAAGPLDDATVATFEQVVDTLNRLFDRATTLRAYIFSFVATDSRDTLAQARLSRATKWPHDALP